VAAEQQLKLVKSLRLNIYFPRIDETFEIESVIFWTRSIDRKSECQIGINFMMLSDVLQSKLTKYYRLIYSST
jgi:hypothetical protein